MSQQDNKTSHLIQFNSIQIKQNRLKQNNTSNLLLIIPSISIHNTIKQGS